MSELLDLYYKYFDRKEYRKSIEVLFQMELSEKDGAWIQAKIGECFYELKNYEESIRFCKKSLKLQPKYPLPLWTIANAYYYNEDYKSSKRMFLKITKMDDIEIGKEETNLGIKWAKSLKMDSYLKIADCCYMLNQDKKAKVYLNIFNNLKSEKILTSLPKWYIIEIQNKISNI